MKSLIETIIKIYKTMAEVIRKGFKDKYGNKVGLNAKVASATENNFASFDAEGKIKDSGQKASDFAAANHKHPYVQDQWQMLDIDYTSGVYSWTDDGIGEETFGAIMSISPTGHSGAVHLAITDTSSETTYRFIGSLSWSKTTTPGDQSIDERTDEYTITIKIGATTLTSKISVHWVQDQDEYTMSSITKTGANLWIDVFNYKDTLYRELSGKLENLVIGNPSVVFDVSDGDMVLQDDTTIYSPLFRDYISYFPVEINVYDSVNDENIPFIGFCKTGKTSTILSSKVFIGERVLVLQKVIATGVTTLVSTYTLGSLLTSSSQS